MDFEICPYAFLYLIIIIIIIIVAKSQSQIQEKQWSHTQENHGDQAIQYREQNKSKANQ